MKKLLKNVDEKSWHELKVEAMRHKLPLSQFLAYILREHKASESKAKGWNYLFAKRKKLSEAEAASMKKTIHDVFEREYDFE